MSAVEEPQKIKWFIKRGLFLLLLQISNKWGWDLKG
jgi:hypothetical protein